jgi:predicted RNA binding protein YcfA (HicA-like mRNA interferase family)
MILGGDPMPLSSKEILKKLHDDGWYEVGQEGSHVQLKHKTKKGKVTVPHPRKDLPEKTANSILNQAGLK